MPKDGRDKARGLIRYDYTLSLDALLGFIKSTI